MIFPGTLAAQQPGSSPVKIFILAGQSNMVGMGQISPATTPGTLEYIVANDPDYAFLGDGAGGFEVLDDVWIRYGEAGGGLTAGYGGSTGSIGPELGFGHSVGDLYEEQVLLIKYAVGGRDLDNDFRPPSSGYDYLTGEGPVSDGDQGYHYQQILAMVADVTSNLVTYFPNYDDNGYEIVGFAWHQGWNDRIDAGRSAAYETNMANFINDIRSDLNTPDLPFVIATSAMDFNFDYTVVEEAQLAMADPVKYPAFVGNVKVIDARQTYKGLSFWQLISESPRSEGFHWNRNAKSYVNLGLAMADAMSLMVPARCPYRLEASGDAAGVSLSWSEGTETPTNLQILRDGVEIEASASLASASYLDAGAAPGLIEYQFNFTMPGDPCPPLTLNFDAGITAVDAYRLQNTVKLTWTNNLDYTAIEVRRDGVLLGSALSGTATSYIDTTPPSSGTVTYTVVPTNGSATPAVVSINLDGLSPGNNYIYESFEDPDPSLAENLTGAGLQKRWVGGLNVAAGSMAYGLLPTSGNQSFNSGGGNTSAGALIRPEFAEAGLLDDGGVLWFSFLTNNTTGSNTAVYFHIGTGRSDFFGGMADGGEAIGINIANGATPQATSWAPGRTASSTSASIASETTALVVAKITWGADAAAADTIEIYLPDTDLVLPASPVSTRSAVLDQSQFDIICFGGKNAGSPKIDEIRFAETYDDVVALSQIVADEDGPTPDPMNWASSPAADSDSSISMTATTASDSSGVEYYFTETSGNNGGSDSGWQDSSTYTDTGLDPETTYTYTVKARDKSFNQNETAASAPSSATTDLLDTEAPATPGFADAPSALSATEITMTATVVTDPSGVEYKFTETSGNLGGTDSAWQEDPTYTDTGLSPETTYSYTVTARDKSVNQNESTASAAASATTPAAPSGPGGAIIYEPFDDNDPTINGNTPGTGLSGTWSGGYDITTGSFLYGSLATSGNRAVSSSRTGSSVSTGSTLSDVALLNDGATLWFSVLHLTQPSGNGNMDFGFALGTTGLSGSNSVPMSGQGIGFSVKNGQILASLWDDTDSSTSVERTGSGASFTYGSVVLVVGEIIWGTDGSDDTINLYLPDTDLTLGSVVSTFSKDLAQTSFDTITFSNKGDETPVGVDEIRFGFSYDDAVGLGGESSDYDSWAGGFSGADLSDPAGDLDGDGFSNEEERIWGLDPTSGASANPIAVPLDPTTGTLTYTRRKPSLSGLNYSYEWSETLATNDWTTFTPASETSDNGDPVESVEITLDNLLLQKTELFIRVEATAP